MRSDPFSMSDDQSIARDNCHLIGLKRISLKKQYGSKANPIVCLGMIKIWFDFGFGLLLAENIAAV
jgi:hypothetical protein